MTKGVKEVEQEEDEDREERKSLDGGGWGVRTPSAIFGAPRLLRRFLLVYITQAHIRIPCDQPAAFGDGFYLKLFVF